jgi:hypothetical protein
MEQATDRSGTQKSRKFTSLVNFYETNGVISAALAGDNCVPRRHPGEYSPNTSICGH